MINSLANYRTKERANEIGQITKEIDIYRRDNPIL